LPHERGDAEGADGEDIHGSRWSERQGSPHVMRHA
jgi:hypothetical protein